MDDYSRFIHTLLTGGNNLVYHYPFGVRDYYAVSGYMRDTGWLVVFGSDGVLETAFPPDDLTGYVAKHGFELLGSMEELIRD